MLQRLQEWKSKETRRELCQGTHSSPDWVSTKRNSYADSYLEEAVNRTQTPMQKSKDDDVAQLLEDAEKLISNANTRKEGMDLMRLAELKMKRETNQMLYAKLTGQEPNIPALEPAIRTKQLK